MIMVTIIHIITTQLSYYSIKTIDVKQSSKFVTQIIAVFGNGALMFRSAVF